MDVALTTTGFQRTAVSLEQEHILPQLPRSNKIRSEKGKHPLMRYLRKMRYRIVALSFTCICMVGFMLARQSRVKRPLEYFNVCLKQNYILQQNFCIRLPSNLLASLPRGSLDIGLAIALHLYCIVGKMRSSSCIQRSNKASPTPVALNKSILNNVMIYRNTSDSLRKTGIVTEAIQMQLHSPLPKLIKSFAGARLLSATSKFNLLLLSPELKQGLLPKKQDWIGRRQRKYDQLEKNKFHKISKCLSAILRCEMQPYQSGHRNTKQFGLEGTFKGHLVQLPMQ